MKKTSLFFPILLFSFLSSCSNEYDKLPPRKEPEMATDLLDMNEVITKSPSDFIWNFLPLNHKFIAQHQMKELLIVSSEKYNNEKTSYYQGQYEFSVAGRIIQKIGSVLGNFNPNHDRVDTFEVWNYFPYKTRGTYVLNRHYSSEHPGELAKESEEWLEYSEGLKYLISDSIAYDSYKFKRRYEYENGKLWTTYAASSNEAESKTKYKYSNGYLSSTEESGGIESLAYNSDFTYNKNGQCILRHAKSKDNEITTTFTYNGKNQLTIISEKSDLSGHSSAKFDYSEDGMLSGVTLDLKESGNQHSISYKFFYQYNK